MPPDRPSTPYFPTAGNRSTLLESSHTPEPPQEVGPILDPEHSNQPIDAYDEEINRKNFGDDNRVAFEANFPPTPPNDYSSGQYLFPSLTRHERLRLTLFWYYTRDVFQDKAFLLRLQEKVDLTQRLLGWEYALLGFLSEDVYTRLVTAGMPLAIIPRRESTCSHNVNQPAGSVFVLPDMIQDWRFKHSPPVEHGGIRAYAGAQIRCKSENGIDVALGSLCVASNTPQANLTPDQQSAMTRLADIISADIVDRSRETRKLQRQRMAELLARVQAQANMNTVQYLVTEIIREIYPHADITVPDCTDDSVYVPHRSAPVPFRDIHNGLWEDHELIDRIILTQNNQKLKTEHTVRAILYPCLPPPATKYIVVSSKCIQYVFDDIDSWFVERCAMLLCSTVQEGRLREALDAKDRFLRGITHQLRTPIHGVLGSVDLLAEELASRDLLRDDDTDEVDAPNGALTASSFLKTIRDSGRELMSTVNNMLKLNAWAETGGVVQPATLQSLNQVEADILHDVVQTIPERELGQISLMFENQLATDYSMIVIDLVLLRECVQALIINALQFTRKGAVIITISGSDDYSRLRFDVVDTGIGIKPEDQERIFEPYEKADTHTRGAGLGLTLAAKIAMAINGKVTLVKSEPDFGSLFRAEFYDPGFACPIDRHNLNPPKYDALPKKFHVIPADTERPDLVLHFGSYLTHRGFVDSPTPEDSIIMITYTPDVSEFRRLVASVDPRHVAMTLIPTGAKTDQLYGKHEVRFFSGPFLTARLEEILQELDGIYKRLLSDPALGETASGTCDKNSSHRTDEALGDDMSPTDSQPRALLVDDNMVNLRIMRMYCEKRKIPYLTAGDGRQAVNQFQASIDKNEPSNLILMDLQMPICDGVDATREIRQLEVDHALQPSTVFMVTGQDSASDKQRSFAAGANEYYVKPMGIKALDRGVSTYFPGFLPLGVIK